MPLKVWSGSAWQQTSAIKVWNGSAWTSASSGKVWNGSAWVNFFGGLPILPQFSPLTYDIEIERGYIDNFATSGQAYVDIILNSSGTGAYRFGDSVTATTDFVSFTWLPSGDSASNYYAYMDTPVGTIDGTTPSNTFSAGSSATATSLVLSTTRFWSVLSSASSNPSSKSKELTSTLRIKNSSGTDLVARTLSMIASVDLGTA